MTHCPQMCTCMAKWLWGVEQLARIQMPAGGCLRHGASCNCNREFACHIIPCTARQCSAPRRLFGILKPLHDIPPRDVHRRFT